ncbi:hypothetical protein RJ639_004987 [Escallonia herrerae]|uniref:Reverse transcriptase/retrotransposon-derived protein RNase H-like domain-containing protein n=1 Tax=Escallonia herrerae TaxID=1293975 RepID=A0AA89AZV4_9ASTE|nr:hypothetical protein RJ639_004987 [Escallonia herrerae]
MLVITATTKPHGSGLCKKSSYWRYCRNHVYSTAHHPFVKIPQRYDLHPFGLSLETFTSFGFAKNIQGKKSDHSSAQEGLVSFVRSNAFGTNFTKFDLCTALNSCAKTRNQHLGLQIHARIIQTGHPDNLYINSALVDVYAKCNALVDARKVFDGMKCHDQVLWTSIITGFSQSGCGKEAICLFKEMLGTQVQPNCFTYVSVISGCTKLELAFEYGTLLHAHVTKLGHGSNSFVLNSPGSNEVVRTNYLDILKALQEALRKQRGWRLHGQGRKVPEKDQQRSYYDPEAFDREEFDNIQKLCLSSSPLIKHIKRELKSLKAKYLDDPSAVLNDSLRGSWKGRQNPIMQLPELMEDLGNIKVQNILKLPKPMRGLAERKDTQLYCHFHKDHGHTTEECKNGRKGNQRRTEEAPPKDPSVINTISGGPSAGGLSSSSRKAYARRFLSKSVKRCLPFFKALKNIKSFKWKAECQASFNALKEYLASYPLLSKPVRGEELFLYLAVAEFAISTVLIREQDSRQLPIYYVSKVLQGVELRYPNTEKLSFALLIAARKFRPYFQSHTIIVLIDKPLRRILHKPDLSSRLVPWSIELGEFDIQYRPRLSFKGHALIDFIVKYTLLIEDEEPLPSNQPKFTWTVFMDRSSNTNGSGHGLILNGPDGLTIEMRKLFELTLTSSTSIVNKRQCASQPTSIEYPNFMTKESALVHAE